MQQKRANNEIRERSEKNKNKNVLIISNSNTSIYTRNISG